MAKRGGFPGMGMPGNMNNLMKQAQKMQRQAEENQKALEEKEFTAKAGGGAVEVTISGKKEVTSSHGVTFLADALAEEPGYEALDGIVLPGGMPGTMHLLENETVNAVIRKFAEEGKMVAAICAAPSVLGAAGLLEGKHATCHPGFEEKLTGATTSEDEVVVDGNIITSRGMGTAIPFAFEIVRYFTDDETVEHVRQGLVYRANEK